MTSAELENASVEKTEEMETSPQKTFKPSLFGKFYDFSKTEEAKAMFSFVRKNEDRKNVIICVNDKCFQYSHHSPPNRGKGNSRRPGRFFAGKVKNNLCRRIFKHFGVTDEQCNELNDEAISAALNRMTKWSPYGVLVNFLKDPKVEISHNNGVFTASLIVDGSSKFSGSGNSIHLAKNDLALNVLNDNETSIRRQYVNWLREGKGFATGTFDTEEPSESEKKLHGFYQKHKPLGKQKREGLGKFQLQKRGTVWKTGIHELDDGTFEASVLIRKRGETKDAAAKTAIKAIKHICQKQSPRKPKQSAQKAIKYQIPIKSGESALQALNQHGQRHGITPGIVCQPINANNKDMGYCATINYGGMFNMSGVGPTVKDAKQNAAAMLLSVMPQTNGGALGPKKKNNKRKAGGKPKGGKKPKQKETAAALDAELNSYS